MEAAFGLLLMLLGVSQGLKTCLNDGGQCYGALGGTVVLKVTEDLPVKLSKSVFNKGNKQITNSAKYNSTRGELRINKLTREDASEYTFRVYDSNGTLYGPWIFNLKIQAPVSSVKLQFDCPSQEGMRVSCSSGGGDGPKYSWTLGGRPLTAAELVHGQSDTNRITLKEEVTGYLLCTVQNHISVANVSTCGSIYINCTSSSSNGTQRLVKNTLCSGPTTIAPSTTIEGKKTVTPSNNITSSNQNPSSGNEPWFITYLPAMASVLSVLVILLVVGVALVCAQKKKRNHTSRAGGADEPEPTYADVRKPVQHRAEAEDEVQYGQVTFSKQPRRTAQPAEDDCVYAKVR